MKDAEGVLKSEDKDKIEAQSQALAQAAQKLGEKIYADSQAQQQAEAGAAQQQAAGGGEPKKAEGDVVDAEFTEVKDKKDGTGR
ncbi:Chaperone protein DnaK [compost metagenome]